jgi:hypothetical protein
MYGSPSDANNFKVFDEARGVDIRICVLHRINLKLHEFTF